MSRVFPSDKENDKWVVRMSIGRQMRSKTKKNPQRTVKIHKSPTKMRQSTEKDDIIDFIAETKKQVDTEAQNAINIVKKWQEDTCAVMDLLRQHICLSGTTLPLSESALQSLVSQITPKSTPVDVSGSINSQSCANSIVNNSPKNNASTNVSTNSKTGKNLEVIGHSSKSIPKPTKPSSISICPPSMPVLFEESDAMNNLKGCSAKPICTNLSGKRIEKRRHSETHYSPLNDTYDFPVRKKSNTFHSSVLAMFNSSAKTNLNNQSNEEAKEANSAMSSPNNVIKSPKSSVLPNKEKNVDSVSNGKENQQNPVISPVYQKFLELKRLVEETAKKKAQMEAKNSVMANEDNPSEAQPMI